MTPFVELEIGKISNHTRPATGEEIKMASAQKPCNHIVKYDKEGFMYHERYCYTCGEFIDFI